MPANMPTPARTFDALWTDLALVTFLVGLDVVARLLPHAPGLLPVAASALFAGRMLRIPALAVIVPLLAMALSDILLPKENFPITLVVFASMTIPALAGMFSRRYSGPVVIASVMLACSLIFFATTNFAVWVFSGIYSLDLQGLTQCYIAALPFLEKTVMGDLFWTGVLFGGAWAIQNGAALAGRTR
jgi:hypothetical protein